MVECFQIDILNQIFAVLDYGHHFTDNLGYQMFRISDNGFKSPVIPTQNLFNQVFVIRLDLGDMVHVFDQTGKLE